MLGLCLADAIRRFAEYRYGAPEVITRQWTNRPYLTRWKVADFRERKVFLHYFQDSDSDELHSHPWGFTSLILSGGYFETTPARGWDRETARGPVSTQWFGAGRVLVRPSNWIHKVALNNDQPTWTLLAIGKKVQGWGFFCPGTGLIPWRKHLENYYATGQGCPE